MTDTDKLVEEAMAACDKAVKEDDVMLRVPFEAILRDLIDAAQGLVWEKAEKGIKKAWANQDPIAIPCPECKGKGIDNTKSAIVAAGHACYPPCPTCSGTGTLTVEEFTAYHRKAIVEACKVTLALMNFGPEVCTALDAVLEEKP